jgi:uncharacterized damage-inducible protein DinB
MVDELKRLLGFNRWANQRLLEPVAELTPEELRRDMGSSFPSVLDTLVHMYGADWIWLSRWQGGSPTALTGADELTSLEAVRGRWDALWAEQQAFLAGLSDADASRRVHFRLFSGAEREQALAELVRHVVNHGTYHRGQLVTLLRQLGKAPPSTDYVQYLRETGA